MPERLDYEPSEADSGIPDSLEVQRAKVEVINALSKFPVFFKSGSRDLAQWQVFCQAQSQRYGETSILTLLPDTNERVITRIMRSLIVNNQIATKTALTNLRPEEISKLKAIGEKSVPLVCAMRNLAIAQLH